MRAMVIFESMYGNTHRIARAIAAGLGAGDITVVPVHHVDVATLDAADLIVVGGPTHVHGMSRPKTRAMAVDVARKAGSKLMVDPAAETGDGDGEGDGDGDSGGVRELLATLTGTGQPAAAFDTRAHGPALFTGRASKGIARLLRRRGFELVARPESFLVTKDAQLDEGEEERARRWGAQLATAVATTRRATATPV